MVLPRLDALVGEVVFSSSILFLSLPCFPLLIIVVCVFVLTGFRGCSSWVVDVRVVVFLF